MSSTTRSILIAACAALLFVGGARAADPEQGKSDDATKLREYQVGGAKNVPKSDESVTSVERPKMDAGAMLGIEKPVISVEPLTVSPMPVSPQVAPAQRTVKQAPTATVMAPRPEPQRATGAPPALPTTAGAASTGRPPSAKPAAPASSSGLVAIATPPPDYPRDAAMSGTQGYVVVEFTLNTEGATQDITVIESNPPRVFDQAARRAVARWRFEPVVVNGTPIEKRVQRRIDFKL